jgi:hypothetical protein
MLQIYNNIFYPQILFLIFFKRRGAGMFFLCVSLHLRAAAFKDLKN